ncbi:conserved hypothetical protein [Methylobacterium sp. 4-46]|uniref:DUF4169 family protein n=1 Tax=unclassified Methylobacterium TaxID=2615210 RepID=UPI000152D1CD|nr:MULTISPECIES: DUF4169 family protein [Methylobacterium]ACA15624.1 conserved hypothetical protein [Methylobacterium sp. 4-46]WFT81338.1 DUF4169 family protein [Methylobacterium nodulans]
MAEIINLRRARKARARQTEEARAEENRVAFGRPKAARTLAESRRAIETARHEGHRLEGPPEDRPGVTDPSE